MKKISDDANGGALVTAEQIAEIIRYEIALKALKSRYEEMKTRLMKLMKDGRGEGTIKKIDNERIAISYVPPRFQEKFDTTKFKNDHPELYLDYCKETEVKESIRITIKKQ